MKTRVSSSKSLLSIENNLNLSHKGTIKESSANFIMPLLLSWGLATNKVKSKEVELKFQKMKETTLNTNRTNSYSEFDDPTLWRPKNLQNILHWLVCQNKNSIEIFHNNHPKAFKSCWNEWNSDSLRPYYLALWMGVRDREILKLLFVGNKNMSKEEQLVLTQAREKKTAKFKHSFEESVIEEEQPQ